MAGRLGKLDAKLGGKCAGLAKVAAVVHHRGRVVFVKKIGNRKKLNASKNKEGKGNHPPFDLGLGHEKPCAERLNFALYGSLQSPHTIRLANQIALERAAT